MTTQDIRAERAKLRKEYRNLFGKLAALLFRHDPMDIAYINDLQVQDNPDEYEPEVGTILPRLRTCASEGDCLKVIHEEFCRWFGEETAGPISNYETIAHEAWIMWNDQELNSKKPELD
jgi:hypothetical protein